ncbi:fatty acid/phospholipid synthesis protein [Reinekea blandensis MED297]|uniref:Phosphate acyltransferase n=2 Tax=Reinekea TaxID=230494 RepID=A4BDZ6_9GAMM|nr:fatty acid/phospholipid synthesis protein [Reinekea blandensis MED297]
MLEDQVVDALVSAEHTGVLLALVTKHGTLHSLLTRPVLASWLPTKAKPTVMLDLGASFSATSDQLLAYAAIGSGLFRTESSLPTLALLNVGTEYFKGPPELRNANQLLSEWPSIRYQGFIEASQVFEGKLDVIVCDGFTGNSVIKASEGALDLTLGSLQSVFNRGLLLRLLGLALKRPIQQALSPLDPHKANGALIAGSNLMAVKSHGNAGQVAFKAAIERSADLVNRQVIPAVWRELNRLIDDDVLD